MTGQTTSTPTNSPDDSVVAVPERAQPRVSAKTEKALREAMDRLFAGKPIRTDGRLIKENLWKEAGVSHATMNRAKHILAEWDARMAATGARTPGESSRDDEIADLRRDLRKAKKERDRYRDKVDAAATVIAALHAENIALRDKLDNRNGLVPLDGTGPPNGRARRRRGGYTCS